MLVVVLVVRCSFLFSSSVCCLRLVFVCFFVCLICFDRCVVFCRLMFVFVLFDGYWLFILLQTILFVVCCLFLLCGCWLFLIVFVCFICFVCCVMFVV